jgi:hypothetical protein
MSTPQRLLITGLDGSTQNPVTHTVKFGVLWSKGGIHAYDWIDSWSQANYEATHSSPAVAAFDFGFGHTGINPGTTAGTDGASCTGYSGGTFPTACASINNGTPTSGAKFQAFADVPDNDTFVSSSFSAGSSGSGTACTPPTLPAGQNSTSNGCTADRIAALESSSGEGNRQIRIVSNNAISNAVVTLGSCPTCKGHTSDKDGGTALAAAGDTGDSYLQYTLTFVGSGNVQLQFGAHVALGANVLWGGGLATAPAPSPARRITCS